MISEKDIDGFFANSDQIDPDKNLLFTYRFESSMNPRLAAANLCCEQSTTQWQRPGIMEDFRPVHGAKCIGLKEVRGEGIALSLSTLLGTSFIEGKGVRTYEAVVAHPWINFGPRIPNLLSAAAGEGPFYCPGIEKIKWIDIQFSKSYLKLFEGPQFGLKGLRDLLGVYERPLFMGVVKPNIGLTPLQFAEIAYQSWLGGLDITKDDEMLGNMEWSPVAERAKSCGQMRLKAEKETGHKKIYLASITDEVDQILALHDIAVENGANSVMVNGIFTGISAVRALRRKSRVPVMRHFTGTAAFSRLSNFGISSLVFTKLQRLAGADLIGLAGFGERMHNSDEEVLQNIKACLETWENISPVLPIPGGSDWAGTLPSVYEKIGHVDFGFISGRGVFGHPQGPRAGAQSLHEAWQAITKKDSLGNYIQPEHVALREALRVFGHP